MLNGDQTQVLQSMSKYWHEVMEREEQGDILHNEVVHMRGVISDTELLKIVSMYVNGTNQTAGPRSEVLWFANLMEKALVRNDHKTGWSHCKDLWLLAKIMEETQEITMAIYGQEPEKVVKECADLGNYAMMLADICNES